MTAEMTVGATAPANSPMTARLQISALRSALAGPFSFALAAGECLAVLGPSGSGKSLLLRMICDLDPNSGEAWVDGAARAQMTAPQWRARVVYQPAEAAWWEPTAAAHFKPEQMERVHALLPRLNLSAALLDADIARLSTGERQRMALIRSLACAPRVLLLDEPTAALDEDAIAATEALLKAELQAGLSIVLVTHSRQQAARLCQRRLHMRERRLAAADGDGDVDGIVAP
ncbi:ATP-binding cassette domain-containing protein [Rugamonas sp.]|uniref:ABC transporter ATP-binding protein n=1 Tax=Rugamonas sp. TaxID=1926287 RepID=UPI0025F57B9C|nr:ABC transporter ATP-binding protein [Rugamonas sp.]